MILSTVARRSGTPKPMWFTVVPMVPPVGFCARKNTSTPGNFTMSALLAPNFIAVPPSAAVKNFFCASMSEAAT